MKYIDTHCHVNFPDFDQDREEVFMRASKEDVGMIVVGTNFQTSNEAVRLAGRAVDGAAAADSAGGEQNIWAIIGLHPIHTSDIKRHEILEAAESFNEKLSFYEELIKNPKVVGVGETGFDFLFHPKSNREEYDRQVEAFEAQIRLADKYKKPLMLHIRSDNKDDAYEETLATLRKARADGLNPTGNAHFFAGTIEQAKVFLDMGFTISFTGVITFAGMYEKLVRYIPEDMLLSETDCPFVAPVPHRGKRNEPAYVKEVVVKMAKIRKVPEEVLAPILVANAKRRFGV